MPARSRPFGPYEVGDFPVITATCTDEDGVLKDPTTITFYIDFATVSHSFANGAAEVEHVSTGIWKCRPGAIDRSAPHEIRVVCTGAVAAAKQTSFDVVPINAS